MQPLARTNSSVPVRIVLKRLVDIEGSGRVFCARLIARQDTMLNALYYPHTDIQSPTIIKNSLLLWDCVETIVPYANWRRKGPTGDRANWEHYPNNTDV